MSRHTIDFGVDLGSRNACIAVLRGTETEVIRNNEDAERTPCVLWLDKEGRRHVGRRAKERLETDPENAIAEFQLQMGSETPFRLKRGAEPFTAEELSAEVLKSLAADVRQRLGEDLRAAVITVPAAFDLAQSDATRRAAQIAGIVHSPLLQEPVAAALAYGFQDLRCRTYWLVYDLRGGTFDAALLQIKDGSIQVVNHGGDNHLGGRLIDWKVIDEAIVPRLTEEYNLRDFNRGNPKWRGAFSKLKLKVGDAKIALSDTDAANILLDFVCNDDDDQPVSLDYDLHRSQVERLAEPIIQRSISICRRVLAERRLGTSDIERIILLGGPTKMPLLRERLASSVDGLGIKMEYRLDPTTLLARGAAMFAGSQAVATTRTLPSPAKPAAQPHGREADIGRPGHGSSARPGSLDSGAARRVASMRQTIDFGIDLGTTNSAVAVLRGTEAEIIKNNEDAEVTPSVVWLDKEGRQHVGRRAKERLETDPENARSEFKLQMGAGTTFKLKRSSKAFSPEDLSAEVLKALKGDVRQRLGEDLKAAVITVPAAFDLAQSEATRRAAQLAGIVHSPLLQEPVAAALAYGFQEQRERAFWLVYDLGGGTFDAALIQLKDGSIQVVNHGGDNHLGGKLIDWKIVDDLVVPRLTEEYSLTGFTRRNPQWRSAFSKLKLKVEEAKISLSNAESVNILLDFVCNDDDGQPVSLDYDISRSDVERLAEPIVLRSINICRQVLADRSLRADDLERVILVGGPTKMPLLRERIADPGEGLGIKLEYRIDPLTVVARGAAIFAGSQRADAVAETGGRQRDRDPAGVFSLQLEFKPIGPETEFLMGGKVLAEAGRRLETYTIEFFRQGRAEWRSGRIALSRDGVFMATLLAEKGQQNRYEIHLLDSNGARRSTVPDYAAYTVGAAFSGAPLTHSIGVAQANNETDFVLRKGAPLPARGRTIHRQTTGVRSGQEVSLIRIPLVEGESPIADGNTLIGTIEVRAPQLKRDIPAGAEIEVTITVDESRLVTAQALILHLDQEFDCRKDLSKLVLAADVLMEDAEAQTRRLEEIREQAAEMQAQDIKQELQRLEDEGIEAQIQEDVDAAAGDQDAGQRCQASLARLRDFLNRAERSLGPGKLRAELQSTIKWADGIIAKHGTPDQKRRFLVLRGEADRAIASGDVLVMKRKDEEVMDFARPILHQQPEFWVDYLRYLTDQRDSMTDVGLADRYVAQGLRAVNSGDVEQLKAACRQLFALLPRQGQVDAARGYGGTTIKD